MRPFAVELWLIAAIVGVLLSAFFARRRNLAAGAVALAGVLLGLASLAWTASAARGAGVQMAGMLVSDPFAVMWKGLLLIFTAGIIILWFATSFAQMPEGDGPEFFTLLLGAALGMSLMGSTSNLLMLVIAVEMASLPSYVLAGFRKTHRLGSEASLKYVVFGAAASAVMIYGLSMLYGLYGTLQLEHLAGRVAASGLSMPLVVGLGGILVGLGFKISAVPLHFWCPDVFEGAGIDVSAFLSVASKGAGLALLLRVLLTLADGMGYAGGVLNGLAILIGIVGAITATVGNTGAFVQTNIKRLLAYSSIAHAGYMLCALSLLSGPGAMASADGASTAARAILLYLAIYLFMNLGAFTVAGLIHRATGSESIDDYAGMARRSPLLAACMGAFMFSLIGLPPFAGFAAKFYVMYALGAAGGWWWALVAVIGLNTVFSLFYYMRVLRAMYLSESDRPALPALPLGNALALACAAALLLLFVGFGSLWDLAGRHAKLNLAARTPGEAASVAKPPLIATINKSVR